MIFGNAGLGVMSSILRVLKAVIYGLWVLPRLDMSTLGREFEQFDSGSLPFMAFLLQYVDWLLHLQDSPLTSLS